MLKKEDTFFLIAGQLRLEAFKRLNEEEKKDEKSKKEEVEEKKDDKIFLKIDTYSFRCLRRHYYRYRQFTICCSITTRITKILL
mgnify:CR=1 FL=1